MEFNMGIPQPNNGDKAPLSLGAFTLPKLESEQDAVNPVNPESKFNFITTVPYVTPEIKSEYPEPTKTHEDGSEKEKPETKEKSKEELEKELQEMIDGDIEYQLLMNKNSAESMKISVDTLAIVARNLFIVGKMMMLLILNKNDDFTFSGKDLGLPDKPPEGKLYEDNEKLGLNQTKSWTDVVKRVEEIKNVEFGDLLAEALSIVNTNTPMKIKKEKSNAKTVKNVLKTIAKSYFPKGSSKSR